MLASKCQKAEHYEISAYGTLAAWAKALDENEAVELLEETRDEESLTDDKLTTLAETIVNEQEREMEGEEDEEEEAVTAGAGKKNGGKAKRQ